LGILDFLKSFAERGAVFIFEALLVCSDGEVIAS